MKEVFRIQVAKERDRDDAVRLLVAQLREHGIDTAEDAVGAAVDGVLAVPTRGRILIAHDRDVAIGVAYMSFVWSLEHGGCAAWLEELYVVPERRQGGTGTAILHGVIGVARTSGCIALDLEVEKDHERVTSLYEREGFQKHTRTRWVRPLR